MLIINSQKWSALRAMAGDVIEINPTDHEHAFYAKSPTGTVNEESHCI
jgi:hypothetical protein